MNTLWITLWKSSHAPVTRLFVILSLTALTIQSRHPANKGHASSHGSHAPGAVTLAPLFNKGARVPDARPSQTLTTAQDLRYSPSMTTTPSAVTGIVKNLQTLATPLDELHLLEGNPRVGDVASVAASLARFGQRKPIVARTDGTVIAGNHTLQAARQLGWTHIAVVRVDDDDATAKAFALADNRTAELGGYDDQALADMVRDVMDEDLRLLADTGWAGEDLEALLAAVPRADPTDVRDEVLDFNDDPTSDDYYTPAWVFEALGLQFDLDVASPPVAPEWIPAARRYTIDDDGLTAPWDGLVWMNPPYSNPGPWVARFLDHGNGVALLPFSNAAWWRNLWATDVAIAVHQPASVTFVGGGIPLPTLFLACGPAAEAALPSVGHVRRLVACE